MSKFKGTKGPWEWQNDESGYSWLGPKDCGLLKAVITDGSACGEYEPDMDVSGHTAHLIAAAPDLLAALQNIVAKNDKKGGLLSDLIIAIKAAKPAIAKALGETK